MNQVGFFKTSKILKRTFWYVALVCVVLSSFGPVTTANAAIPKYINFQGKLTKVSDGTNVSNSTYAFEFKIYDASTAGTLLWTETYDQPSGACGKLTVTNAIFNAKLGSCNSLSGVDFTGGSLYLSVNFAPTGTSYDGEMSPRKQLVASPFAFIANGVSGDGKIDIANTGSNQATIGYDSSNKLQVNVGSTGFTTLTANGAGAGFNLTGGNVGIGTTTATQKLTVSGNIAIPNTNNTHTLTIAQNGTTAWTIGNSSSGTHITINTSNLTTFGQIASFTNSALITQGGNSTTNALAVRMNATYPTADLQQWQNSAGTALSVVNASGNIGIGTTTAGSLLTVGSTGGFTVNGSGAITATTGITSSGTITFSGLTAGGVVQATAGTGVLTVGTLGASAITADALDFTEFKDAMTLDASTDIAVTGSNVFSITNSGSGNSLVVNDQASDTTPFVIDAGGNVGIGTTTIGEKITATGVLNLSDVSLRFGANTGSSITNGSVYNPSGQTIKLFSNGGVEFGNNSSTIYNKIAGNTGGASYFTSGNVGIGTSTPAELLQVAGDIMQQNSRMRTMTRTLPTVVNDAVDIGSFTLSQGAGSLWVSITVPASSFSVSKEYLLPIKYSQTASTWAIAPATSSTGSYGGNDFDLDINVAGGTTSLRIRRTAGSTAGTAYIVIQQDGVNTDSFTASTATASVAAPTTYFSSTALTQVGGNVGIGTTAPAAFLHVVSSSAGEGLRVADSGGAYLTFKGNLGSGNPGISSSSGLIHIGSVINGTGGSEYLRVRKSSSGTIIQQWENNAGTALSVVDGSGNIGIGDTTPASALTVGSGDLFQVNSSGAITAATGVTSSGTITFSGLSAGGVVQATAGTGALTVGTLGVSSGGTGATSLTGVLIGNGTSAITGTTTSSGIAGALSDETGSGALVFGTSPTLATPTFTTSATGPLLIGGTGTTSTLTLRSTSGVGTTGADIIFQTGNNGATEVMRILNNGNVGIGSATPGAKLDVAGNAIIGAVGTSGSITFPTLTSGGVPSISTTYGSNTFQMGIGSGQQLIFSTGGTGTKFKWNNTEHELAQAYQNFTVHDGGPGMRLTATGLGVGTTSPDAILEIAGNKSLSAWGLNGIALQGTAATYTDSSTAVSGTATNAVFNSFGQPTLAASNTGVTTTNAATVYIADAPAAGTNQTITNPYSLWVDNGTARFDGNVGIGSTSPNQKLVVSGGNANINGILVGDNGILGNSSNAIFRFDGTNVGINSGSAGALYLNRDQGGNIYIGIAGTNNVGIGTNSASSLLTIGSGTPTTAANGLNFGTDTSANLYRSASATIKTDGTFNAVGGLQVNGANINTAGTLNNVAYLNQANTFSTGQTINVGSAVTSLSIAQPYNANGINITKAGNSAAINISGTSASANGVIYSMTDAGTSLLNSSTLGVSSSMSTGFDNYTTTAGYFSATQTRTSAGSNADLAIGVDATASSAIATAGTYGYAGRFTAGSANITPLLVKGASSQTSDLFQIQNSGGTGLLTVNSNGNVGIGTTSPGYKLDVNGAIKVGATRFNWGGNVNWEIGPSGTNDFRLSAPYSGAPTDVTQNRTIMYATDYVSTTVPVLRFGGGADAAGYPHYWGVNINGNFGGTWGVKNFGTTYTTVNQNSAGTTVHTISNDGSAYFAGNVGIGTNTPGAQLDVTGASGAIPLRITSAIPAANKGALQIEGTYESTGRTALNIITSTSDAAAIRLMDTSNVTRFGISYNSNRTSILQNQAVTDISGTNSILQFSNSYTPNAANTATQYGYDFNPSLNAGVSNSGGNYTAMRVNLTQTSTTGLSAVNLFDIQVGGSSKLLVKNDGNVGIGTTNPADKLQLGDGTARSRLRIEGNENYAVGMKNGSGGTYAWMGVTTAGNYQFSDAGGNPLVTFAQGGNVGIGTTSPASLLSVGATSQFQVNSSGAIAAATGITSSGTITFSGLSAGGVVQATAGTGVLTVGTLGASAITADALDFTEFKDAMTLDASTDIAVTGSNVLSITNSGSGNSLVVNDQASDTTPFVIDAGGNVGIGTSAPATANLHISASATRAILINAGGALTTGLYLNASTFDNQSAVDFNFINEQAQNFIFSTNNTERLRIGSTGFVGIGDSSPASLFTVGNGDLFQINSSGQIGSQQAPQSDYLLALAGTSGNDHSRIIDITQANDANEDTRAINIVNTANPGAVANTSRSIYNIASSLTPTVSVTSSSSTNLDIYGGSQTVTASGITLGNTTSGGLNAVSVNGSSSQVVFNPTINDTVGSGLSVLTAYGSFSNISNSPTYSSVAGTTIINTFGSYSLNSATSAGNANVTNNSYGTYGLASGNLTTTGTTAHYGGYFGASGTADTNYGIYADVSGATANYAGIFTGGNVGIGTTGPTSILQVSSASAPAVKITDSDNGTGATDGLDLQMSNAEGYIWNYENGGLTLATNNTSRMYITSSGSIGIGTTTPFNGATVAASVELGTFNGANADGNLIVRGYSALGGISKSSYGAVGSNYYLDTTNVLKAKNTDHVSLVDFSAGGFLFKSAGVTSANATISLSELARLTNTGNFGIGDNSPAAMLTVGNGDLFQVNSSGAIAAATGITSSGTINFSGLTASSAVYTDGSKNLTSTAPTSGAIGYWSRSGTTLQPTTSNDVISVSGNSGDIITIASSATGSANKALNVSQTGATVGTDYAGYFSNTGAATTNVGLYTTASGGTNNYAAIFDQGNVGIGTTAPTYGKLDVRNATSGVAAIAGINSSTTGTNYGGDFETIGAGASSNTGIYAIGSNATSTNYGGSFFATGTGATNTAIFASASGGTNNYAAIFNAGNVGIGDGSPAALLTVGSGDLFQVNSSGAVAAATGIISSGTITFSGLGAGGAVQATAGTGTLTVGTLGVSSGGTGATTLTGVLIGNGTSAITGTTTSSGISGALSDETGSGALVFGTSPTLATPTFTTSATGPLLIGGTGTTSTLSLRSTSGVGTTGADIIFQTGNNGATEAMRILNNGNVGIGTTNPQNTLVVRSAGPTISTEVTGFSHSFASTVYSRPNQAGAMSYWSSTNGGVLFTGIGNGVPSLAFMGAQDTTTPTVSPVTFAAMKRSGTDTAALGATDKAFSFYNGTSSWTNGAELVTILGGGNVGVGTTGPTSKLQITNAGENILTLNNSSASSVPNWNFAIGSGGQIGHGQFMISEGSSPSVANAGLRLTTGGVMVVGNSTLARITPGASTLDLQANSTAAVDLIAMINNNAGSSIATSGTTNSLSVGHTFAPTSGTGVYNTINVIPTINQTGGANGVTRGLYINPTITAAANFRALETVRGDVIFGSTSGNVGIGTTTLGAALHVVGGSVGGGIESLILQTTSTGDKIRFMPQGANNGAYISSTNNAESGYTPLYLDGSTIALQTASAGNVAIGTTTAGSLLTVGSTGGFTVNGSGAITAATGITSSGTINFSGLTASSAVYTDGSKNLTSTAPTSGAIGYWSRSGTTLSTTTAGDNVTTSGNISTSSSGTITSASTLTASNGLTLTTGALNVTGTSGSTALTGYGTTSITSTTTTGNINTLANNSLAPAASATANLLNLSFTNGAANGTGTSTVAGVSITPTISNAAAGTQETYAIRIQDAAGTPSTGTQNIYGIRIGNQGRSGAEVSYGLYVDSQSGSTANYAAVFAGGNVGIGTTTPGAPLDVQTNGSGNGIIVRNSGTDYMTFQSGGVQKGIVGTGALPLYFNNASGIIGIQTGGGNVAIGTTTAGSLLTVGTSGGFTVNSSGAITAATGITSSGTINFSGLTASSLVFTDGSKNLASSATSSVIASSISDETGSGALVFATSPTLTTPNIGAATGTSLALSGAITGATGFNGLVVTANTGVITTGTWNATAIGATYGGTGINTSASTGVPSISSGTWSVNAQLPVSLGGTGAATLTGVLIGNGTSAITGATTSSGISGALSDETGSGALVFGTAPTFTTSATGPLFIGGTGTTSTLTLRSTSGVGTTGADIIFQTGNNGATEAMRILNSGSIGVATSTPGTKLHIVSTGTPGGTSGILLTSQTSSSWTDGLQIGDTGAAAYKFLQSYGSNLILNPSGNSVGIGDTSPAALFTVGSGDLFQVNSSGAIAAATGITSSGTINFSGLTASSAVYTDGSKNLTTTTPSSGTIGYWSRSGTTIQPATSNDVIAVSSNAVSAAGVLDITASGTITSGNNAVRITANSVTTGTGINISATGVTTGSGLTLTGPSTTGVTTGTSSGFFKVSGDVGSAGTAGILSYIAPDFSAGSITAGYGEYINGTDSTSTANVDVNFGSNLTLTGNAAKTAYAGDFRITSTSTTADSLYLGNFTSSVTGAISTGTRNMYGAYFNPATNAASTGGTTNIYGGYFFPSGTGATTGATVNVYGGYFTNNANLTTGGTVNGYGLYVANGNMNTTGTSTQYGIYVAAQSGADNNYAAVFAGGNVGIGTTAPGYLLQINAESDQIGFRNAAGSQLAGRLGRDSSGGMILNADLGSLILNAGSGADGITLVTNNTNKHIVLQPTGNVGIGTTTPGAKLFVNGNIQTGNDVTGVITLGRMDNANEGAQIDWTGGGNGVSADYDNWSTDLFQNSFRAFTNSANTNLYQIFNNGAGEAHLTVEGSVGIGTLSTPGAKLEVISTATTGTAQSISVASLTTGQGLNITGPTTTGVTGAGVLKVASDVGSGGTQGILAQFQPDFSAGIATSGYGVAIVGTDSTNVANSDTNFYSNLALTGNAAKNAYASYNSITTSSTTADNTYAGLFTSTASGAISTGTRNTYGVFANPSSTGANTGGTTQVFGSYLAPSATNSTTGSTVNVFGNYIQNTATLTTAGTITSYGMYIANGSMNTTGTSTQYGLYVAAQSGADNNYAAYFGGSVGIGTTNPTYSLEVNAASTIAASITATATGQSTPLQIFGPNASNGTLGPAITLGKSWGANSSAYIGYIPSATAANNLLTFGHYGAADLLTIAQGGNVGIGTTNANALLHIKQSQNSQLLTAVENVNAGTSAFAEFQARNGTTDTDALRIMAMGTAWTTTGLFVQDAGVIVTDSTLSGGLSIGTRTTADIRMYTNSTQVLTAKNGGVIQFNTYGAGTLTTDASGNITASSDARLKTLQGDFTTGLAQILNIHPALYKWNNLSGMETNGIYAGFVAQDIQNSIPEAVSTDSRGYLTLSDRPIIAASVNAIKELNRIVVKQSSPETINLTTLVTSGLVLNLKTADTSLLSIDYVGTARFAGTVIVKKDVAVLGRVLGSTAIVAKNTSNQTIHQGDVVMLTGATEVPLLGDNPTITVSPAIAGMGVIVGIADRNLADFNLDQNTPAPTDPTEILPGEFLSIVITGTYKKAIVDGPVAVGDKLTASTTPGHVAKLEQNTAGQMIGISLDAAPAPDGSIRIIILSGFQAAPAVAFTPAQSPTTPPSQNSNEGGNEQAPEPAPTPAEETPAE